MISSNFFDNLLQMEEIHMKSNISYKGKILGSNLYVDDPTKTVFAIMLSSLCEKWSCVVSLLPFAFVSAEKCLTR